jgi:alpha-mannosidase
VIEIERPEMVLSALKLAEDDDAVIARVYNIAGKPVDGRVRFGRALGHVERVDLNEENAAHLQSEAGAARLQLKSNEIEILRFR